MAAKQQALQSFVIYDRYPGLVLVVAPGQTGKITSVRELAGKKVGVSSPGSSTDFFLKYQLKKAGVDPNSAAVIGVGLGATAVVAMEQGVTSVSFPRAVRPPTGTLSAPLHSSRRDSFP